MRTLIIIVIIIGCILGYGYWHAYTHASFHIQLDFKDADGQKPRPIPGAEIIFLDSEGKVLAKGIRINLGQVLNNKYSEKRG